MVDTKKGLKGKVIKKKKAPVDSVNGGNRFTPIEEGTLEKMRSEHSKFYDEVAVEAKDRFDSKQGKLYKREKMKVKRGSSCQLGTISQRVNSVKFTAEDDDGDQEDSGEQQRRRGGASGAASVGRKTDSGGVPTATKGQTQPKKGPTRIVFSD